MDLKLILSITQIVVSALLILVVLLQSRGSGLSAIFGGEGSFYHSKRGIESGLFYLTIIFVILLIFLSFGNVIVH